MSQLKKYVGHITHINELLNVLGTVTDARFFSKQIVTLILRMLPAART